MTHFSPAVDVWLGANGFSLKGKRILLTGATGSLGSVAAEMLLRLGAELLLPVRSRERGLALEKKLLQACPQGKVSLQSVDMASFESVDALLEQLAATRLPIDCLVHGAGVFTQAGQRTRDGLELHRQVNALSPLRLTRGLTDLLLLSPAPKVATVTSLAAFFPMAQQKADDFSPRARPTAAYARSKRELTLGMESLAGELPQITFTYAHPGVSATGLFSGQSQPAAYHRLFLQFALPLMRLIFPSPDQAALPLMEAILHGESGQLAQPGGWLNVWGPPLREPLKKRLKE